MSRTWDGRAFDRLYAGLICDERFPFGTPEYYTRYRSRYKLLLNRYCSLAPSNPVDVLDVGGGQLALLASRMWGDRAAVADLPGQPQLNYLESLGIAPIAWNLCEQQEPCGARYDFIFFSEVIEHLPLPGHIVLQRLRRALKRGGMLICSTPNVARVRNILHLVLGRPIMDHMDLPGPNSLGHVIEYSRDDLQWQLEKAGFRDCTVEYHQMHHLPVKPVHRVLSCMGYPLFLVPHFRDNLVAVAVAP
jgi:SAM-dependent methyltransferase